MPRPEGTMTECEFRKAVKERTAFFLKLRKFNDNMIRRTGLPKDVMCLIHDLCYHHDGRDVYNYVERAQAILKRRK